MSFLRDLRVAFHSLSRTKGLAAIVILTLALGIGANAAIFTLVRGVLLKPLVNRGENRLIYIRQSAPGLREENTTFSVPELRDLEGSVHSVAEYGEFSSIPFTMIGLGQPRTVLGGVVSGSYFEVMGLHPILGRLIGPRGPAHGADAVDDLVESSATGQGDAEVVVCDRISRSAGQRAGPAFRILKTPKSWPIW